VLFKNPSGRACVERLVKLGFISAYEANGLTVLRGSGRLVAIPLVSALTDDMLDAILRSANVSRELFFGARKMATVDIPAPPSSRDA
jgi:hypothetical protein